MASYQKLSHVRAAVLDEKLEPMPTMSSFRYCCCVGFLVFYLFSTVHAQNRTSNEKDAFPEPEFVSWLPEFKDALQSTLVQNCSDVYQKYEADDSYIWENDMATQNLISCMLQNTPEWRKSNMASAAVMLGLIPTILGLTGSHVAEVMLIGMFRPALAVFINYGAPVLNPTPTLSGIDPLEFLQPRKKGRAFRLPRRLPPTAVVVFEYVTVFAAAGNFLDAMMRINRGTLVSFAIGVPLVPLWWFAALHVFAIGEWALARRVRRYSRVGTKSATSRLRRCWHWWGDSIAVAPDKDMAVTLKTETRCFSVLSFLNTVLTACHILFGTVVFSSLLFIGFRDAALFAFRIFMSHLVCRGIVMFEMNRLRATVKVDYGDEEEQLSMEAQSANPQKDDAKAKDEVHVQVTTVDEKRAKD